MSISGAEIPATSAANDSISSTRRRQLLMENSVRDPVSDEVVPVSVRSAKVVSNGKEVSRGSKRNSVVGKSKDFLVIKKGAVSSTDSPRRRKSTLKPEKSKWETILNILIKNLLLLAVLFWIGQTIWRWADKSEHGAGGTPFAALEFEGRISEVETSLKKMTKMTQVQLEVMDERGRQLSDKNAFLERELSNIAARTDNVDKSISKLSDADFLSKKEFETILSELKETSTQGGIGNSLSLDDVTSYAKEIILKEIEKHAADGLGRADYALASGGGKVVKHSEPYMSGKFIQWLPMAKGRNNVHSDAYKMLEPSFGEPGKCFPLKGITGFVEIRLRTGIIPDAITLEHVSKSVAYDRSSAPKDCNIYGWFDAPEDDSSSNAEKMVLLKQFRYDLERSNAQTFDIDTPVPGVINTIRLDFSSNHGSPSHTCIYRLRVHGHEP